MNLLVLTPEKEIFKGKVTSVQVPGISGKFEILNNHAPIVSALTKGKVRIIIEGVKKSFEIKKGFIEVLKMMYLCLCKELLKINYSFRLYHKPLGSVFQRLFLLYVFCCSLIP